MKLICELHNIRAEVEDKNAEAMEDVYPLIKQLMLAVGFANETVSEWFPEED